MTPDGVAFDPQQILARFPVGDACGVSAAARAFGCSPATAWRWITAGIKLRGGGRAKLAATRVGGFYRTSRDAAAAFLAALAEGDLSADPSNPTNSTVNEILRSPTQRRRAATNAAERLAAMGVGGTARRRRAVAASA
jgi:hypothetical protein